MVLHFNHILIVHLQVSCGTWHACALDDQGQLFIWGYNKAHGVLGMVTESLSSPPVLLPLPQKLKISGVSCGNNFTIAWTTCGQAFSWGYGHHGALGHGDTADRKEVTKIQALRDHVIVTASAGYAHSGCVTDTGRVFMFGKGSDGALGLGPKNLQDATTPTLLPHLDDVPIAEVSCSVGEHHGHTLAVTQSGGVYAWGDGYKGKLGLGDQESRYIPTVIPQEHFGGEAVSHVSSGGIHSSAVSKVGQVSTWGCGSDGRLGHPEAQGHRYLFRSDVPRIVDKLKNIGRAQCVSASYYHTVALMEENK